LSCALRGANPICRNKPGSDLASRISAHHCFDFRSCTGGAVSPKSPRLSTLGAGLDIACGLLPWLAFSDALSRGTNSLIEHSLYLRKLAIPEEVYIAKSVAASSIYFAILLCFLVILAACDGRSPGILLILLPVISALLLLVAFGVALTLAPLNVLMRDIGQTLPLLLQLGMWLSPILYPAELMPYGIGILQKFNPFSPFLAAFRSVVVDNQIPESGVWLAMVAWAIGTCAIGAVFIQRLRPEVRGLSLMVTPAIVARGLCKRFRIYDGSVERVRGALFRSKGFFEP